MLLFGDNDNRKGSLSDPWGDKEREAEQKAAEKETSSVKENAPAAQADTADAGKHKKHHGKKPDISEIDKEAEDAEDKFFSERVDSFGKIVFKRFIKHRLAIIGLSILLILILLAIFAPLLTKYDYKFIDLSLVEAGRPQGPSKEHLFGVDLLGRDYFTRILYALRTALIVGFSATAINFAIGVPLGFLSGWYGGKVDWIIQRGIELSRAIPSMFLMMVFSALTGGGVLGTILVLGFTGKWSGYCRGIRAYFFSLKEQDFVQAARATGMGKWRLWTKHMLPYALAPELVSLSGDIAGNVASETGLSFLGFGVQEPTPSLGAMLSVGRNSILIAPWLSIIPGLVIALVAFSCNFIGDGLRDAFDPRTQV